MKIRINIKAKYLYYVVIFIVYTSSFITELFDINHFYTISTLFLIIPFAYNLYYYISNRLLPAFFLITVLFYSVFVVFTMISNTDQLLYSIARLLRMCSYELMIEYLIDTLGASGIIDLLQTVFEVLIYGNLVSMIVFPNGIHRIVTNGIFEQSIRNEASWTRYKGIRVTWLLGHQTTLLRYVLPAIVICLLYSIYKYSKLICLRTVLLMLACVAEMIIANSAANFIIIFFFFTMIVVLKSGIIISTSTFFIAYVIFYSIIGRLSDNMRVFLFLSEQLGRTVKISTRVSIWQNTISAIFKHPFIGYGAFNEESTYIRELLGLGNPHSEFLWVAFEAGIVGMIAFIIYIHLIGAQYNKSNKNIISVIIYASFYCVLLSMITDDYLFRNPFTLLILCLVYNISQFDDSRIYDKLTISFRQK